MIVQKLGKDATIYGGSDFITRLVAFFVFPLIAAALSADGFGALELLVTVTSLLGMVMNCGLNNAVQRHYWDKETPPAARPSIVTSGFFALFTFGLALLVCVLIISPFLHPFLEDKGVPFGWIALIAATCVAVFTQWIQYFLDVARLQFSVWKFFRLAVSSRVFSLIAGVVALVGFDLGIEGLLTGQAIILLLLLPFALLSVQKDFRFSSFEYHRMVSLVQFGYPFIHAGIAFWLLGAIDRWMLAYMLNTEEVGIYSVAFRLASVVLFVSIAFGQAWSPISVKIRTDYPSQYRSIYGEVLVLLLVIMMVSAGGFSLFAGEVIGFLMPVEYRHSAIPLIILCFGIVLQATQQITAVGISLEKKTFLFARLAWLTAIVNFLVNWVLIPYFGATGAAIGTLISYIFLTGGYLVFTQILHPILLHWKSLFLVFSAGFGIFFVSIILLSFSLEWQILLFKVFLGIAGLIFLWTKISLNTLKKIR